MVLVVLVVLYCELRLVLVVTRYKIYTTLIRRLIQVFDRVSLTAITLY